MKNNNSKFKIQHSTLTIASAFLLMLLLAAAPLHALSSANVPLDSPVYLYLEKLAGFGLITSDIKGLKPFSRGETARMVLEAERNLSTGSSSLPGLAGELIKKVRESVRREVSLLEKTAVPPLFDYDPVSSMRMRYVFLDGAARDYDRWSVDPGHQNAFGIFGGDLRPFGPDANTYVSGSVHVTGSEGTPLLENNNGTVYHRGSSGELRWGAEGYFRDKATVLLEPVILATGNDAEIRLNRGYFKLGGGWSGARGGKG